MSVEKILTTQNTHPGQSISLRWAFMLIISLFFMWGVSYGLLDVLNKHFQETLHVTKAQSGLLQGAYFGAYFLIAMPAGYFMSRYGYKAGVMAGLVLYAIGALLFVPASMVNSFQMFLFALFVLACGLGCLETAANPYAILLGDAQGAERRLNLAQSFNGLGQFIGPIIGGTLFFTHTASDSDTAGAGAQNAVQMTYVVIAIVVILIALLFKRTSFPDIREAEEPHPQHSNMSLWQHKHFVGGIIAQFFYVAAQVGVGAFFINYVTEHWHDVSNQTASYMLSIGMISFMVGRFFSTWLLVRVQSAVMLSTYAIINVVLCGIVMLGLGDISVIALIAIFFFMSSMFPTIFAMGVKNLGSATKKASSFMIMAIVGGAIMPYFMGFISDKTSTAFSFILPLCCFIIVLFYALNQRKNKTTI